ncbi:copper amine oxidase N-terminal domain-containing protein [Ruminiclostridium cellobioparum]|jgi:hypothetical protein|uniref:copper amine oxidase N-terminal domain-containing protein n=1 Tax=Ruminiclostridium cellobioparum TaxID=29355 RepID=UPI0028AED229|nr:copper amine oxidase N-terminal domain-containing protein [Ruminiclostridium cellobioparum]
MKKYLLLIIFCISLFILSFASITAKTDLGAIENSEFTVKVNDKIIDCPDAKPYMDNNHQLYIPVKYLGDALGATVSWNGKTKQVAFQKDGDKLIFTIGKAEFELNGTIYKSNTAAIVKNNRAFISVEYITDALGADVLIDMGNNNLSISFIDKKGYTEDNLQIYCFDGKEYVSVSDVWENYKCMIVGDLDTDVLTIYGNEVVAAWDLAYTRPLMEIGTESYVTKNDFNYFEVDYFENNIKPILNQPREAIKPAYSENGLDIYLYNGTEYVLPGDIGVLLDDYMFKDVSEKNFNFVKRKDEGNIFCEDYDVIVSGIPATIVNGRLSIEYEYYKKNILPKIEK